MSIKAWETEKHPTMLSLDRETSRNGGEAGQDECGNADRPSELSFPSVSLKGWLSRVSLTIIF